MKIRKTQKNIKFNKRRKSITQALNLEIDFLKARRLRNVSNSVSELERVATEFKKIYNQHLSLEIYAFEYISILNNLSSKQVKEFELENIAKEAQRVYEYHHTSVKLASEYVSILINLSSTQKNSLKLEKTLKKTRAVYDEHDHSVDISSAYLKVLSFYFSYYTGECELTEELEKIKCIYDKHDSSEEVASSYLRVLNTITWRTKTNTEIEKVYDETKRVYDKHKESEIIASEYIRLFVDVYLKFEKSKQAEISEKIQNICDEHHNSKKVAIEYLYFLSDCLQFQNPSSSVKKAKVVYNRHKSSDDIASIYLMLLSNLYYKSFEETTKNKLRDEAKVIFDDHTRSEQVNIVYALFLTIFCSRTNEASELEEVTNIIKQIFDQNQTSIKIAKMYLEILMELLEKYKGSKINDLDKRVSDILTRYPQLKIVLENTIDKLLSIENDEAVIAKKFSSLFTMLSIENDVEHSLIQTKYGILFNSCKNMSNEDMEKLINIFCIVQKIKKYLIVREPCKLEFGHYTNGKVLQIFLKQKNSEKHKYAIETSSRLNNVNYMNDPSEGKVLDQFLEINTTKQKLSLKPSPWFLMSLTTAIDQLTMWSQYGDQAKGVCLVLNSEDFLDVMFSSDSEWLTSTNNFKNSNNQEEEVTQKLTESKDFIYRIGYLSKQDNNKILLKEEHNTHLAVEKINNLLSKLKEILTDIDKESLLYEKFDECIEEVRYLFKSADYSYESELRVLKYMPLEPDNPKIKIDDSGEFAKLYIERDNPIQISEVIFGPKFPNPENVTPLLHLLDKNIKFRQSDISYR